MIVVLDTTVLVYAVGVDHPLREPCRRIIEAITRRELEATTTAEVIQEFAHVRARRRGRADAAEYAAEYVDLLAPLIEVGAPAVRAGLRLFAQHDRLGAFDSVLAAAASSPSVRAIVSADRAFDSVPGLVHVFPDAAGVDSIVSAGR